MPQPQSRTAVTQALGGGVAIFLFVLALAAFVIQSSLTQYVQGNLGFRQPFFLLYIAHSSFITIFPLHLLYLLATSPAPISAYFAGLRNALTQRLSPAHVERVDLNRKPFPTPRFFYTVLALTVGINVPGTLWYASVSLASIGDVTALWNTNSFWVYVLTVKLYSLKWEAWKLGAVVLACVGVILDVYGGSKSSRVTEGTVYLGLPKEGPTAPVLGDALTLIASISYALYQVLYKRYVALRNDHEEDDDGASFSYESLSEASAPPTPSLQPRHEAPADDEQSAELPFGLYANFMTSCMGLCTFLTLAIGFPILHLLSIERFTTPPDTRTLACVAGIASAGVVFNSCFMILLGLWGPVLTSVGNLLTIVLVLITDFVFNGGMMTAWSLLGSGMIVAAFGILVLDMVQRRK